jgi:anti-sigma regulatory factor (Ser/Thr protein kinase)
MDATNRSPERDTGPSGGQSALEPGMRWRRVFPGDERQLGMLRRWLASLLPDCQARHDVACVATELGTNAIVHTASGGRGGSFAVEITWHRTVVRVAVADCGAPDGPRVVEDPAGLHGRGLVVVRGLSVRTGVCGDQRGRLVWADIPWDDAGAAEPASSQDPYEAVIRDSEAGLASRFAGVPVWFGRSTLQWWALAGGELVAAPSAQELARLLGRALNPLPSWPPAAGDTASADARAARVNGREQRPGIPAPRPKPGRAHLPQGARNGSRTQPRSRARRPGPASALASGSGLPAATA